MRRGSRRTPSRESGGHPEPHPEFLGGDTLNELGWFSAMNENAHAAWPQEIAAITLFVEDLPAAKHFYGTVFKLPVHFEDDSSVVFRFGDTLVNLLHVSEAPDLVAPAEVAGPGAGVRFQFTLAVDDVDAMVEELTENGVELLNGPMDRPWGVRTASFRDPGGHVWEIAC